MSCAVELDLRLNQWSLSCNGLKLKPPSQIKFNTEVFPAVSLYGKGDSISFINNQFPAFYPTGTKRFTGADIVVSKSGRMVCTRSTSKSNPRTAVLAGGVTVVGDGLIHADTTRPSKTRWTLEIGPKTKDIVVGVVASAYDASEHDSFGQVPNCFGYYQSDGKKFSGSGISLSYGPSYREGDEIGGGWMGT